MQRKFILILLLLQLVLVRCKKEKDEGPPPDVTKGLLAYFELNGQFKDSADGFDVTYGGFLSWAKNRYGYGSRALACNGGAFTFTTAWWRANPITISLWVKPNGLDIDTWLVSAHVGSFGIHQQQSKIGLAISHPDTASALAGIKLEWTHVAGTFDGNDIKTYINGKLAATLRHPGTPDVNNAVIVGAFQLPEWKGTIDDLRFYNRVLSEKEIKILSEL